MLNYLNQLALISNIICDFNKLKKIYFLVHMHDIYDNYRYQRVYDKSKDKS